MKLYRILSEETALEIAERLSRSENWKPGNARTAGLTGTVKQNEEILNHADLAEIGKRILNHPDVQVDHLALQCSPPKFSRYRDGARYQAHTDAPWMGTTRTDLSCTLWLSKGYYGGELIVDGQAIKGAPGQAFVYPCGEIHEVRPVTSGQRIAVVTWIESRVRDLHKRTMLSDMRKLLGTFDDADPRHLELTRLFSALLRMWME